MISPYSMKGLNMRSDEVSYWEEQAQNRTKRGVQDHTGKRRGIVKRLLDYDMGDASVLEIGVGQGVTFSALQLIYLGHIKYHGTDLSPTFVDFCTKLGLKCVVADATCIPWSDKSMDYIVLLDSFEHINPADYNKVFAEMARLLRPYGKIILNLPANKSKHDDRFDHEWDIKDITKMFNIASIKLLKYEAWVSQGADGSLCHSVWIVGG